MVRRPVVAQKPPASAPISGHSPGQLDAVGDDAVTLRLVTRQEDHFDEGIPRFRAIDGHHDREPALIEGDRIGQALLLAESSASELMSMMYARSISVR